MKITVNEKKSEATGFDYSEVEQDSKRFDFVSLLSRLSQFKGWLEDLQAHVPEAKTPELIWGSEGSSGFAYTISTRWSEGGPGAFATTLIDFDIDCGTNPEKFAKFEGKIYVGDEKFLIKSVDDLTDELIDKIKAAVKASKE